MSGSGVAPGTGGGASTLVQNPVLPGTYPDPTVCRVGEDYYLVTSTFEYLPGLPVFHSRDLVRWEQLGHVIDRPSMLEGPGMLDYDGIRSSGGLYAPTLRHRDGVFWLVCTLVGAPEGAREGNFVVTATDPAGPWSDPVWIEGGGIDPSLFFDDDGRVWAHGTRLAAEPEWDQQTEVWVRELDADTKQLVGPETIVWSGAVRGAVWAEGPHLYKVDGTYYLLAAEGGTDFHHALSVARADHVTGPYTGNKANPVLTHRHLGQGCDIVGVGHADLVEGPDGSWWALLLGMRPYGGYHYNLGRETFLVPVEWQDGWPVFAPGVGRVTAQVEVPFVAGGQRGAAQGTTSGPVLPDDLRWTSPRALPSSVATPRGDGWDLRVLPTTLTDQRASAFLAVRQQHMDVDVRVTLRAPLGEGEEAGIAVRQSEADHVRLALTGGPGPGARRVVAVHRQGGVDAVVGEVTLDAARLADTAMLTDTATLPDTAHLPETAQLPDTDAPCIALAVRARGQDYTLLAGVVGGEPVEVATIDGRTLDSVSAGGFVGLWIGVFATSNGAPSDAVVHVERLEYLPVEVPTGTACASLGR